MMKNFEFYALGNKHPLLRSYALRGVVDERGSYGPDDLLKAQHRVYMDWLEHVKRTRVEPDLFSCSFYEWMLRNADTTFVARPGDLVKYKGQYCLVKERVAPSWCNAWRVMADGTVKQVDWPQPLCTLGLEFPNGHTTTCDASDEALEPAGIPPEVFALACGRAKNCPMMMKGGDMHKIYIRAGANQGRRRVARGHRHTRARLVQRLARRALVPGRTQGRRPAMKGDAE